MLKNFQEPIQQTEQFDEIIINKTIGEVRTFLSELANGTSGYKSLHNLTEQVEHQYHGRFLIELLQNAHDALFEVENHEDHAPKDEGRIEIVVTDEPPFGCLYVANDGKPFTQSNFNSLSRFGQSDKDPAKSIGNKGIGFRSVLEICLSPEIYSRESSQSAAFNGFCFRFSPEIKSKFQAPILDLLNGDDQPVIDLGIPVPLVKWGNQQLQDVRSLYIENKIDVAAELKFLSPYLLPEPASRKNSPDKIHEFEEKGFSTVVRLPFISQRAWDVTCENINLLDEKTVLFLQKLKCLWIEAPYHTCYIERTKSPLPADNEANVVDIDVIHTDDDQPRPKKYWVWNWEYGGGSKPEEAEQLKKAAAELPGKWKEVDKAGLAIAIPVSDFPERGLISIFLPTKQPSGAACHLNAPFYGDISRTCVDFQKTYNKLLLENMAMKAADLIHRLFARQNIDEARAILDILAPVKKEDSKDSKWFTLIESELDHRGHSITELPLLMTRDSWKSINEAKVPLSLENHRLLSEKLLYECASYDVINYELRARFSQIKNLFSFLKAHPAPADDQIGQTIENAAQLLFQDPDTDWNAFWDDVMGLLPNYKSNALQGKKIILGVDGELHASSKDKSIFFGPRTSEDEDDEVLPEQSIDAIPIKLRKYIAFLSKKITVKDSSKDGGRIVRNDLYNYLANSLVQAFGVESILRDVLLPATPTLPVAFNRGQDELCSAICNWGSNLLAGLIAKDKGEKSLKLLAQLPFPCQAGWYPLNHTSFGPGWNNTVGQELNIYLQAVDTQASEEAEERLLLPPDHKYWGQDASRHLDMLSRAGAMDGLRLKKIDPDTWDASCKISLSSGVRLPEKPPSNIEEKFWKNYCEKISAEAVATFKKKSEYTIDNFFVFPGLDKTASFDDNICKILMDLLIRSIGEWEDNWGILKIEKQSGQLDTINVPSPLRCWLGETPWLIEMIEETYWRCRPKDRWYIPLHWMSVRLPFLKHLNPFPADIALAFESQPGLVQELQKLGMPVFHPETKTRSPRLLMDLAMALERPDTIASKNVFLGQVRDAWKYFEPEGEGGFPDKLVVTERGQFKVLPPSESNPIVIPDVRTNISHHMGEHIQYVLVIETKDAKRLKDGFKNEFGSGVRFLSEIDFQPMVDGQSWKMDDEGVSLRDSTFSWSIPLLMCCHAYAGDQSRGPQTKTFSAKFQLLNTVKLVLAERLELGIWEGDDCKPISNIKALWIPGVSAFAVSNSVVENKWYSSIADELASMLDRADLTIPLKLALSIIDGNDFPDVNLIKAALNQLDITEDQYSEVTHLLQGDFSRTISMLRPVLKILAPKKSLAALSELLSESDLNKYIEDIELNSLSTDHLLAMIRDSKGMDDLGFSLYQELGSLFQLSEWNKALIESDESPVENQLAEDQFQDHLESANIPVRSLIRKLISDHFLSGTFSEWLDILESIHLPDNVKEKSWEVNFNESIKIICFKLIEMKTPSEIIGPVLLIQDVHELLVYLKEIGCEPETDPVEIFSANQKLCLRVVNEFQKIGILWCITNSQPFRSWEKDEEYFIKHFDDDLEKAGYLRLWDESMALDVIKNDFPRPQYEEPFWQAVDQSKDLSELKGYLKMTETDLGQVEQKLEKIKFIAARKAKTIKICGKDFENLAENYSDLFDLISNHINEKNLPSLDINDIVKLKETRKSRPKYGEPGKKRRMHKPKGRMSEAMKQVVGLSGEIHAYRVLQKQYGQQIVNPSTWVSELSTYVYPGNMVSDSCGYDFQFRIDKKKYYIEVKATQGDEEIFDLGSSEIIKAVEVANRRKEKYQILHVTFALSDKPQFRFLPNPYDSRYSKFYEIHNAGLKIRYLSGV